MYLDAEGRLKFPGQLIVLPVNGGWSTSLTSGAMSCNPLCMIANTYTDAGAEVLAWCAGHFLRGTDADAALIDWDRKLVIEFGISRVGSDSEVVARFQLKEAHTIADLAAKGFGIVIKNLALYGEAYDTEREEVDLSVAMTDTYPYLVRIEHDPGVGDRFYVNNVLKATSTHESSGDAGATSYFVFSIVNGVTGGVEAYFYISPISIWQDVDGESAYVFHQKE